MNNIGFLAILRRDLLLAVRYRGDLANPLIFFFIVIALIPLGLTPDSKELSEIAPGMLWITALLASLLSLDGLFKDDFADGTLEQIIILPQPLYFMVLAKTIVHWVVTGLPLSLLAPVLGLMLSLPETGYLPLMLSLLIGTAILSLIGSVGAALTLPLNKEGILLSLIVIPFYMPVLIFGSNMVVLAVDGLSIASPLAIMGALLALSLLISPYVTSCALRLSIYG
ncbi:heme exporter protein CcmB [Porticoccus sp.]|nr:heme exporter protein CcmB [Porticoccus sp.]MDC0412467.1 heme exporter protein CcmB [Porticoccus sp.]MDC1093372.1 heme exporter protein CcmB [Porticoccus sp.]MDC1270370.1 heme exporter protein CcmB [Porticoccus sp.]